MLNYLRCLWFKLDHLILSTGYVLPNRLGLLGKMFPKCWHWHNWFGHPTTTTTTYFSRHCLKGNNSFRFTLTFCLGPREEWDLVMALNRV